MSLTNARSELTITGKGLKYPFWPVKHSFDSCLSSLQFFKSKVCNSAIQGLKVQTTKRRYLNAWNIVKDSLTTWTLNFGLDYEPLTL